MNGSEGGERYYSMGVSLFCEDIQQDATRAEAVCVDPMFTDRLRMQQREELPTLTISR